MELVVLRMRITTPFAAIGHRDHVVHNMDTVETTLPTAVLDVKMDLAMLSQVPQAVLKVPRAVPFPQAAPQSFLQA